MFNGVNWTWISGLNSTAQAGNYGIQGTPSETNIIGARKEGSAWMDIYNNFWVFGGIGSTSSTLGLLMQSFFLIFL